MDYTLYPQGSNAIAEKILYTLDKSSIRSINETQMLADEDIVYWFGYVLMEWLYDDDLKPRDLLLYNWESIYLGYDVLHTQSIKYTIEIVKSEHKKRMINHNENSYYY